jgi:branched-chain amino acid transport system substrate-binding protein
LRVSFTAAQFSLPGARWAARNGFKTGYVIVSDYAPGHEAEPYFTKGFESGGGKIIGNARTPQQETNFSAYMEKVLQAKPDVLFMFQPAGSPSIALVKAYVERGLKAAGIKLVGTGETQQLFLPNFTDDVVGVVSSFPYTETNARPENVKLKAQLTKMFGDKAEPDIASVEAWDGTDLIYKAVASLGPNADGLKYIDFMKGKTLDSPRGPIMIDPDTRDIVQNMYIRQVEKRDGKLINVDIGVEEMIKDPWKIDNPPK